jgi:hypothetical protein
MIPLPNRNLHRLNTKPNQGPNSKWINRRRPPTRPSPSTPPLRSPFPEAPPPPSSSSADHRQHRHAHALGVKNRAVALLVAVVGTRISRAELPPVGVLAIGIASPPLHSLQWRRSLDFPSSLRPVQPPRQTPRSPAGAKGSGECRRCATARRRAAAAEAEAEAEVGAGSRGWVPPPSMRRPWSAARASSRPCRCSRNPAFPDGQIPHTPPKNDRFISLRNHFLASFLGRSG